MILWGNVVAIAPELANVPAAESSLLLGYVNVHVDDCVWGDTETADFGRVWLAAHLATIARRRGAGPLTSESVGALARSYGLITGVPGAFGMTSYGAMYYQLTRQLPSVLGIVP